MLTLCTLFEVMILMENLLCALPQFGTHLLRRTTHDQTSCAVAYLCRFVLTVFKMIVILNVTLAQGRNDPVLALL